jgi:hypothetical protein
MAEARAGAQKGASLHREDWPEELHSELGRRLHEIASYPEATFGPLDVRDLIATTLLFVLLPLVVLWMFR